MLEHYDAIKIAKSKENILNSQILCFADKILSKKNIPLLRLSSDLNNIFEARSILRPSPVWGTSFKPNQAFMIDMANNTNNGFDLMSTSSEGYLLNNLSSSSRKDNISNKKLKIAFLGGSTIAGTGSRLPFLTIPALTEKILQRNIDTECINYGVPGMSSRDSLSQLIDVVLPTKPDHVVMYGGWNCAFNFILNTTLHKSGMAEKMGVHRGLGIRQIETLIMQNKSFNWRSMLNRAAWLSGNSFTSAFLGGVSLPILGKLIAQIRRYDPTINNRDTHQFFSLIDRSDIEVCSYNASKDYLRIMTIMRDICKASGVKFTGIFQPNLFWGEKFKTRAEDQFIAAEPFNANSQIFFYNALVQQKFDGWVHDFSQIFCDVKEQTYIDTGHKNPFGNLLVSERIADLLLEDF